MSVTSMLQSAGNNAVKSWRTTLIGVLGGLVVIIPQVLKLLDADPDTLPDWNIIAATLAVMLGLSQARDNNVSSEAAGKVLKVLLPIALIALFVGGCASVDQAFVRQAREYHETIGDEYRGYVQEDPALDPAARQVRIDHVDAFGRLLESAEVSQ